MKHLFPLIILLLIPICSIQAQIDNQYLYYQNAEMLFKKGYFEQTESTLLEHIGSFKGIHKMSAYRLLALCKLESGHIEEAKEYIKKLLQVNPYYSPSVDDPQRFVDMINEAKAQESGITTASRQAESIDEAPVPVTVITEDMIRFSGASTIQELLCLYVPGMSQAEGMESNIAMHGLSGLTQEMILFLQDGHRLNSGSTNAEAPDYRNSLDKIQQIEVLRGPASSLYGNVALTAVVNIITYKGAKLNGGRISATTGTQKTYGGSFVVGGGNNVVDITGWGSVNSTEGFKHTLSEYGKTQTIYAHGFNRRPSYDMGIKGRWGDFTMTINSQRSKQVPYFNIIQLSANQAMKFNFEDKSVTLTPEGADFSFPGNFTYKSYPYINSNGPGATRTNHHINLDYSHSFGNIDLQASGYVSLENTSLYNVLGDSVDYGILLTLMKEGGIIPEEYYYAILNGTASSAVKANIDSYVRTSGDYEVIDWENISFGGQIQSLVKYNFLGHGSTVFGVQYDHFALTDGTMYLGGNYKTTNSITKGDIFTDGMENIISGYLQVKHYFWSKLILNAGLRYDHKIQFNHKHLNNFSPRVAFIYKFDNGFSARASYTSSYVDAPFLYRASRIPLLGGAESLKPETMKSVQLGISYLKPHLSTELSAYYNRAADLITQTIGTDKDGNSTGYSFRSSGNLRQLVVEAAAQYNLPRFMLNANVTWQRIMKSMLQCNVINGNRLGVPQLMGNIAAAWAPYVGKKTGFFGSGKVWINGSVSAQTATYYQKVDLVTTGLKGKDYGTEYVKVNPQVVFNLGVTYDWKYLDISVNLKNITNNEYKVGSNLNEGVPHAGRQIIGKFIVKF